jgi:spermidine synthase
MSGAPERRATASLAPLLLLFLLSGVSALVYQVLWMRLLALVFGVTIHAASTVLAAFMAGLAIGSAGAGRLADAVRRPLAAFAVAEALVAVAALATPFALRAVEAVYLGLNTVSGGWPLTLAVARFALSFAVLVVPATLMGATLPLVVKSAVTRGAILGRQVSLLYAANTAGAVIGTIVAGTWMIPQLGIAWAFRIGAVINLAVAAGAMLLDRLRSARATEPLPAAADDAAAAAPATGMLPRRVRQLVLVTFAVSGFVSFGLEIVWFRMLILLFRPTTYAFTVMLATVLAGIAIGSWIATPLSTRRIAPLMTLAILELLVAVAAAASMVLIGQANAVFTMAGPYFAGGRLAYFGPMVVTSIAAIFPPALLLGMAFPVGVALWASQADGGRTGRQIGSIYAVNVAAAVLGSLATGFLLLPAVGSRITLLLISSCALVTGLLLLVSASRRLPALAVGAAAVAAFGLIAVKTPDPVTSLLKSRYPRELSIWRKEDGHATVTILRRDSAFSQTVHGIYVNGTHQASDLPTMVGYHRLIGTLPMAVHGEPKRALVIGAGGGATAGALAAFDDRVAVDVVELSPAVVDAARRFGGVNQGLFTRPNVRVRVDDGRNYMMLTSEKFDVVTADVILPQHAGAGNLYSVEYYRLMRRVLTNRGIAVQWIGSPTDTEYKLIMRTFVTVFPHTTLWYNGSLMIGSLRPLVLEEEAFERKLARPSARTALEQVGLGSFQALIARYTAGPGELRAFVGEGQLLTDDRPLTEYFLSLPQNDAPIDLSQLRGDVNRHVLRSSVLGTAPAATASPSGM